MVTLYRTVVQQHSQVIDMVQPLPSDSEFLVLFTLICVCVCECMKFCMIVSPVSVCVFPITVETLNSSVSIGLEMKSLHKELETYV